RKRPEAQRRPAAHRGGIGRSIGLGRRAVRSHTPSVRPTSLTKVRWPIGTPPRSLADYPQDVRVGKDGAGVKWCRSPNLRNASTACSRRSVRSSHCLGLSEVARRLEGHACPKRAACRRLYTRSTSRLLIKTIPRSTQP